MEKNRKILLNALRNLPVYPPDNKEWEGILAHLEKNSSSARLPRLSKIEPPKSIWDKIDKELTRREKRSALNQYNPSEKVWENIDRNLSVRKANRVKRRIFQWVKWSSAAAAIFTLGFFIFTTNNTNNKNFSYSEEWLELRDVQKWDEDEQVVEQTLDLICRENPIVCISPEFKKMEEDLEFLNQSKRAILRQLSKYDTNTELEIMLTEIELERTSIIKEVIAKTI